MSLQCVVNLLRINHAFLQVKLPHHPNLVLSSRSSPSFYCIQCGLYVLLALLVLLSVLHCQYMHLSSAFASSPVSVSTVRQASLQAMQSFYQTPAHSSCLFFFITVIAESRCSWKELPPWSNVLQTGLEQSVSRHSFFHSLSNNEDESLCYIQ